MAATPELLEQVAHKLHAGYAQAHDPAVQAELNQYLQGNGANPTFNACLAVIAATSGSGLAGDVRQLAALQLKKNICEKKKFASGVEPVLPQVQEALLAALGDAHEGVQRAAASSIAAVTRTVGVAKWPSLVTQLLQRISAAPSPAHRLGVLHCVCDLCEDCASALCQEPAGGGTAPAVVLLQGLVPMLQEADLRSAACCAEAMFHILEAALCTVRVQKGPVDIACGVLVQNGTLLAALDSAQQRAAAAPGDLHAAAIRNHALRVYRLLLVYYDELHRKGVLNGLLRQVFEAAAENRQGCEEVALSACEFWSDFAKNAVAVRELARTPQMLPQLVDLLLRRMPYSEMEIAMIDHDEKCDDLLVSVITRGRRKKRARDNDDADDSAVEQWTVRKAAALSLDCLANSLCDELVSPQGCAPGWLLQTQIQPRLQSPDWRTQEVAVLVLGAIAKGCYNALQPHLGGIVTHLLGIISDDGVDRYHYLVRSIACWTLSRFDNWIANQPSVQFFDPYLYRLMQRISDNYRRVQECAVSAFAMLVESSTMEVCQPQCIAVVARSLGTCLQRVGQGYTTRNTTILMDALGTLCWAARENMNTEECKQLLFVPIWTKLFPSLTENHPLLPHAMTCMVRCIEGLGTLFRPYIPSVYPKVLSLVGNYWMEFQAHKQGQLEDPPEVQHVNYAYRVCGTLITELRDDMRQVITTPVPGLGRGIVEVALLGIEGIARGVDRSVFDASVCFTTDCFKNYPEICVEPVIGLLPTLMGELKEDDMITQDIIWACGELCCALRSPQWQQQPEKVAGAVTVMANGIVPALIAGELYFSTLQQAACAVGRMGLAAPQLMAQALPSFIQPLCANLTWWDGHESKLQAVSGVMTMIKANFGVLQDPAVVRALTLMMAKMRYRSADITLAFVELLQQLRQSVPPGAWPQVLACFPHDFPCDIMKVVDPAWTPTIPPPPPGPPPPSIA
eukprot:TRINITY_DN55459_c0_g1_i1.p1 TRINITY_DN55459_c0_g1~~TRINITY_DN55459_c0_g1_i1.p1  ORF type:complete len:998 (+),score=292.69 TRINITY_DN55459_c0_g1_i1:107-2995(+)